MAWIALDDTQWVSRADLQDAVDNGVFTLLPGQTIPGTDSNKWVSCNEVVAWLNASIDSTIPVVWPYPVTGNEWPQKSWIVALQNYIWVEGTFTCEQEGSFVLQNTYTGFSSPYALFWYANKNRFYMVDADDGVGHFSWFNPDTITGLPSLNHLTDTAYSDINTWLFDKTYGRIYATGDQSGGMKVVDLATDTVTTLAYGTNTSPGSASRSPLGVNSTTLYAFSKGQGLIKIYDRATLTPGTDIVISTVPSPTNLSQGFQLQFIGSEIWVIANGRNIGTVARYNSTFTSLLGTITLPGIATAYSSQYWQPSYYDADNNKLYICDDGSKKIFVIDTTTNSIITTHSLINFRGKQYADFSITKNELDGYIYIQATGRNTLSDASPNYKLYKVSASTGEIVTMYPDVQAIALVNRTGTNEQWGCQPGVVIWNTPNTGYSTDGLILKYT